MRATTTMEKVDWQQVIKELQEKGYTQKQIEVYSGVSQSNISKMKAGKYKDPAWSTGNALLKLLED